MKFLLTAVNAKYIHSNPAVYSLRAYGERGLEPDSGVQIEIAEYTINHQMEQILQDIYRRKPDAVGFSCYIWNISHVLELARDLHKVLPETEIWLGGPEVSFCAEELLEKEPQIRGIMRGEGEEIFARLVRAYGRVYDGGAVEELDQKLTVELARVPGITYRVPGGTFSGNVVYPGAEPDLPPVIGTANSAPLSPVSDTPVSVAATPLPIVSTPAPPLLSMDEIPFYYGDMAGFENRIVYYESSRGCPFSCSYCLSSINKSVRFRSLSLVERELQFFLDKKVPQVKFVDRTFNCKREHTLGIWRYILAHDNGVTNFHFEVSADLFDEEELELISQMRPGLIQLEIGVQSTNPATIGEIRRKMNLEKLKAAVARIRSFQNTHQHLDLIAGLPHEDFSSFLRSFDEVHEMAPDQLQLGFLKVLKGSHMETQTDWYGLKFRSVPPYEVLSTRWLSYGDVIWLKEMEEMVEVHYNSGQFSATLALLQKEFLRPSAMYLALADYYREKGLFGISHNRLARYEILYRFLRERIFREDRVPHGAGSESANGAPGPVSEAPDQAAGGALASPTLSPFRDALLYDLYLRENLKSRPSFASDQTPYKAALRAFFEEEERERKWLPAYEGYEARQLIKMAHLEVLEDGRFILFDYKNRSPLTGNARAVEIPMEKREHQ